MRESSSAIYTQKKDFIVSIEADFDNFEEDMNDSVWESWYLRKLSKFKIN